MLCHFIRTSLKLLISQNFQFSSVSDEYDELKNAIFEVCDAGTKDDRIFKDDLLEKIQEKLCKTITWTAMLRDIKRLGYVFDKQARTASLSLENNLVGASFLD